MALLLLAWLAVALVRADAARASCPTPATDIVAPSCFEAGDGNQTADGVLTGRIDWETVAGDVELLPDDSLDSHFGGGDKEMDPTTWNLGTGSVTGKSDIISGATLVEKVDSRLFLYSAFHRPDGSGDANLSVELNQLGELFDADDNAITPPVPKRSEGDLLITFDGNNSQGVRVGMCIWHGDEYGEGSTDPDVATFGWYTLPAPLGTGAKLHGSDECTELTNVDPAVRKALGAMNNGTIQNSIPTFPATIGDNLFGEMAVDLVAALKLPDQPDPCVDVGSIWIHSRASSSPLSEMKDYVAPAAAVGGQSCAIDVDKTVSTDGGATFQDGTDADPAFAQDGDTLTYRFAVTNPGVEPITDVVVSDPKCDAAPSGPAGDDGDGTLEPGETWTYTCTHVLQASDPAPFPNTVTATGTAGAQQLSAQDSATVHTFGIAVDKRVRVGSTGAFVDGPVTAHVGDTLEYQFTVTSEGDAPLTVTLTDDRCDSAPSGPSGDDGDGKLEPAETWTYTCSHVLTATDPDPFVNTVQVTGTNPGGGTDGDTDSTTTDVIHPDVQVVKDGPATARHGDSVTFTYTVTNIGDTPLHDVSVSDDKCAPVTQTDDGDQVLAPGETATFSCSLTLPAHADGEENPLVNTATVTAKDPIDGPVSDSDQHSTTLLHPAVALDKTGPATAKPGDKVPFTIVATNTGDEAFPADKVTVTDPLCEAAPVLVSKGPDGSPEVFDPGDQWTYTCSVQTTAGQKSILNTALVTASNGEQVSATDDATTILTPPAQAVLGEVETLKPVVAAEVIRFPAGKKCLSKRSFTIRIAKKALKGAKIAQLTVTLNGKRLKVQRGKRVRTKIVLKGLPKGRYTVKVALKLTDGRVVSGSRKYRTCVPKRKGRRKLPV